MAVNQPNDSIGAVSTKMFVRRELSRPWARMNPLVQMLLTRDLTKRREFNIGRMLKAVDTVSTAEAYKWGVEVAARAITEVAAGLDIYYTRNSSYNFNIDDNKKDASQTPSLAHFPCTIAASDLNIFAQATDNPQGIRYLYNIEMSALHTFQTKIENALVATVQTAGKVASLIATEIKNSGVSCGIDPADYPIWISKYRDLATQRLTIDQIAEDIRSDRRVGANPTVIFLPPAAHDLLVKEARALNMPMFNLVDIFGENNKTGEPLLDLEVVVSTFRIEGVALCPLQSMTGQTKAFMLSMDDIALVTSIKNNFEFLGWKNVELEAGKDQQRALFRTSHFIANYDRSHHRLWDNIAVS